MSERPKWVDQHNGEDLPLVQKRVRSAIRYSNHASEDDDAGRLVHGLSNCILALDQLIEAVVLLADKDTP